LESKEIAFEPIILWFKIIGRNEGDLFFYRIRDFRSPIRKTGFEIKCIQTYTFEKEV